MNQNSISTRVSEITISYLDSNYKNKFQGARMCLESYPVLREESIKNIKGIYNAEELALLVFAHKGENLNGKDLAARRKFEVMIADYYEDNKDLHITVDFADFIGRVRKLGCMERFVLRELTYGVCTNPTISDEIINYLSE